ncbi:MAG TPA: BrnT family toxin [Candidatus Dormibacteraeota bacterium]|nr:BrnT family toxin [Candidatus Dormibacteraeota bacterium]
MPGLEFAGFEWDQSKSARCLRERGFDFDYAARVFFAAFSEREARRGPYDEMRFLVIGEVGDVVIAVVWTQRGNLRRIISARPASRAERKQFYEYREAQQQGHS